MARRAEQEGMGNGVVSRSRGPLVVAQRPTTLDRERQPFIALSTETLRSAGVDVRPWSSKSTFTSPPTAMHVHWPDHALGATARDRLTATAFLGSIARAKSAGSTLVCTAHNLGPHSRDIGRFDHWFLNKFDAMVDDLVVMSRAGIDELLAARPRLRGARLHHVRHGHFRPIVSTDQSRTEAKVALSFDTRRKLVVFAGQIRSYKGVPDLLRAVAGLDVDVLVAGRCASRELRHELQQLAAANPLVQLTFDFLSATELSTNLRAADLVVLPYRRILNSGAAMLALSADRRVLVPDTPTFGELREEVGPDWVPTFPASGLTSSHIAETLATAEPEARPDLSHYEWRDIGDSLQSIYLQRTEPLRRSSDAQTLTQVAL